jgi:tellurite resistance protein TehA-like permease
VSGTVAALIDRAPPAAGAAVMGTGIVAVGLGHDGHPDLSDALLALAICLWLALCAVFAARLLRQHERWRSEARRPAALTGVAATAVVGAGLSLAGVGWGLDVLAALAVLLWCALVVPVLRSWETPAVGGSFMLVVATESLAVMLALVAAQHDLAWLGVAALVPCALGVAGYAFVLSGFELRQLLVGRGDHWISGGALAIATLACARAADAVALSPSLAGVADGVADASLALWVAAIVWLPVLVVTEVLVPRLGYDLRRWSAVFPLGMYAVCSMAVGDTTGHGWVATFGRAWIWVAVAVWAVVFGAAVLRHARA